MRPMKQILLCLVIATALAGCGRDFGMPLESGEVRTFGNGYELSREALSPDQLRALSEWFEEHRFGWYGLITPASAEPAQMQLELKHTDGKRTFVSVIVQPDGGRYLRLTSSEKWPYRAAFGAFKSWAAARKMSQQDFAALESLVRGRSDKIVALNE